MYCPAAERCSWTCSWILETRSSCEALSYVLMGWIPVVWLSVISLTLDGAPSLLSGKTIFGVLELDGVVLKVLFGDFDVFLLETDVVLKLSLPLGESAVLVGQVVWENGVVLGLLLLDLVKLDLVGNKVLSELSDQFSDLLDGLEVNLGVWGELSKSGDDGLKN